MAVRHRAHALPSHLEGPGPGQPPCHHGLAPYFGLDLDPVSESFVVLLNEDGTRLLRSWRHVEHCTQCGGEATGELSLDELRIAARA